MIQTMSSIRSRLVAAGLLLVIVASACSPAAEESSPGTTVPTTTVAATGTDATPEPETNPELDGFVRQITDWDAISPNDTQLGRQTLGDPTEPTETVLEVEATNDAGEEVVQREAYVCSTQDYSLTENPREVVLADPSAGQLWPGALLDGAAHAQGQLRPVAIDRTNRGPLGISVAGGGVLGIRSGISTIVDEPTGSTVREGVNQLIANALESEVVAGAGYSSFESVESHSSSQVALELGLSARYLKNRLDARLDYSKAVNESSYTAYFIQRLYTIAIDAPQTPADFFAADVTPAELTAAGMGPDTPPLYVGSVSYGRILMYSITSSDSAEQIAGAIEYSYNALAGGVSAEVAASYEETLRNARIEVLAVGGPNAGVENLIATGDLASYFEQDLALNQVEPIAFTVNRLSDNQLAEVVDTTEYTQSSCELVGAPLPQPIHWWPMDGTLDDAVGAPPLGGLSEEKFGGGRFGQAFSFDGSVGSANTFGEIDGVRYDQVIPTDSAYTVSAWVNPRSNELGTIISQVGQTFETGDMAIRISEGKLFFYRRPAGGDESVDNSVSLDGVIPLNRWSHITVVYGAEADTSIQLYVDGEDVTGQLAVSRYLPLRGDALTRVGTSELLPQDQQVNGATAHRFPLDGALDELMIFDRALTATEVAVMHQNFEFYKGEG
ncbi:MAG: thiol-activated cytolysin family protein [Actinomycetota bacterium]